MIDAVASPLNCPQGSFYGAGEEWRVAGTLTASHVCLGAQVTLVVDSSRGLPSSARYPMVTYRGETYFAVSNVVNTQARTITYTYESIDMLCSRNTTYRWVRNNIGFGGATNVGGAPVIRATLKLTGKLFNARGQLIVQHSITKTWR